MSLFDAGIPLSFFWEFMQQEYTILEDRGRKINGVWHSHIIETDKTFRGIRVPYATQDDKDYFVNKQNAWFAEGSHELLYTTERVDDPKITTIFKDKDDVMYEIVQYSDWMNSGNYYSYVIRNKVTELDT